MGSEVEGGGEGEGEGEGWGEGRDKLNDSKMRSPSCGSNLHDTDYIPAPCARASTCPCAPHPRNLLLTTLVLHRPDSPTR